MSRSARALADRFISHGSPGGVLETAGDISRLTGSSVIKVMRGALGSWRMRAHGYRWQTDRTFLSQTARSEEHTSELQSLMRISYAVFCLKKKNATDRTKNHILITYNTVTNT